MKYPEIRIKYGWLLKQNASKPLHKLWGKPGEPLVSDDKMWSYVTQYNNAWQPYEMKIVEGMCQIVELEFRQNIIDVYIAPWFAAFSDPMVIGITNKPDEFIDVLTHELLHRLLTDNTTIPHYAKLNEDRAKMFGEDHNPKTLVHIPVHAVHKAIYLDILKEPERLEREIDIYKKADYDATPYLEAWNYVNKHSYKEIIEKLKDNYAELKLKHQKTN